MCCRRRPTVDVSDADIVRLVDRITPDNAPRRVPAIVRKERVVAAVFNGGAGLAAFDGASIRLGVLAGRDGDWGRPHAPAPDGSYALFRVSPDCIELVADAAATRTIWYALTNEAFVASSSQRAIVSLLGDFQPNREASAWMLSSGTLGPGIGWDVRVRCVAPGERVILKRAAWRVRVVSCRIDVSRQRRSADAAERQRLLAESVERAAATPALDHSKWIMPLSGGVDCRGLLLALKRAGRADGLRCVTWGESAALEHRDSDAFIARRVAERLQVEHRFFPVELAGGAAEKVLERFLAAGEGRVAALPGYLDGFALWKSLSEQGVEGIVRGDEAFGWKPVADEQDVRRKVLMTVLQDFFDERNLETFDLPRQRIPNELQRRADESLEAWRDRLYQQFRLPYMLSALTDLKAPYVEVLNPLLYASVLAEARKLPDELRTDKRLWQRLVESWLPGVPFARRRAAAPLDRVLADPYLVELFLDELRSQCAADALGREVTQLVSRQLETKPWWPAKALRRATARFSRLRRSKPRLDPALLGVRATIVSRMSALLREDAALFAAVGLSQRVPTFGMSGTGRAP